MKTEFWLYCRSDYDDLQEMVFSLYREDPEGEAMNEEKITRTIAETEKNPDKVSIYMLKRNEKTIGYAILVNFWSNEYGGNILTIDELYVKTEYRGQGAGTEFFSFVEDLKNKTALQLETTPSNQKAYNFYTRLGFVPDENTHFIKRVGRGPGLK